MENAFSRRAGRICPNSGRCQRMIVFGRRIAIAEWKGTSDKSQINRKRSAFFSASRMGMIILYRPCWLSKVRSGPCVDGA
jgi:hypothetical protein